MRIRHLVLISICATLLAACATTDTVSSAQGEGSRQAFAHPYDAVYRAALGAARKHALEIVEQDADAGRIVLSHGVTLWSWGERVAIFLTRTSPAETGVEIVSRPVLAPLNFPSDWESRLMFEIGEALKLP